ncbi:uncharacterized protein LOC126435471 [Schistocerca serialis cubense]|uniref:uncharacterized protein LOC126435471 n=1 Tax=Schistocerca serialis cubense TaxID=2023355 RepID=UPI00214E42E2|nr:uncharacterized protein LOC126435471 [Schistocerca serialis cubense]
MPARCVKCAGLHATKDCRKPESEPPKCVVCSGDHPASWKGCPEHQKYIHRPRQPTEGQQKQRAPSNNRQPRQNKRKGGRQTRTDTNQELRNTPQTKYDQTNRETLPERVPTPGETIQQAKNDEAEKATHRADRPDTHQAEGARSPRPPRSQQTRPQFPPLPARRQVQPDIAAAAHAEAAGTDKNTPTPRRRSFREALTSPTTDTTPNHIQTDTRKPTQIQKETTQNKQETTDTTHTNEKGLLVDALWVIINTIRSLEQDTNIVTTILHTANALRQASDRTEKTQIILQGLLSAFM